MEALTHLLTPMAARLLVFTSEKQVQMALSFLD
jgi:hypothetical protein